MERYKRQKGELYRDRPDSRARERDLPQPGNADLNSAGQEKDPRLGWAPGKLDKDAPHSTATIVGASRNPWDPRKMVRELREEMHAVEAANRAKSAFMANMSHEIRTPMNAIIGLTHLLQRANPTPDQAQQLTKIENAAGHLLSIINDILDFSRIEAGKLSLERSDFQLNEMLEQLQSMFKDQLEAKNLTLELQWNDVPNWLRGDPTRMRQALINYLGNAIKFTESGSISIRARVLERYPGEALVRFEVQDTGIGIPADKLPGLFKAFEQIDSSTTRNNHGSGLGLAITKRLAQLMGGRGRRGERAGPGQHLLVHRPAWHWTWRPTGCPIGRSGRYRRAVPGPLRWSRNLVGRRRCDQQRSGIVHDEPRGFERGHGKGRPRSRGHGSRDRLRPDPDGCTNAGDGRAGGHAPDPFHGRMYDASDTCNDRQCLRGGSPRLRRGRHE